jgi:transcriptional regulator with XRE-family HTH domain
MIFTLHFHSVQNLTEKDIQKIKDELPRLVGARVKKFRNHLDLTQTELAQAVGKDRQYLYKIEKGIVTPNISTLGCLAEALGITLSVLLEDLHNSDQKEF